MRPLLDGELAQLPVFVFLRQVVRRTQETLKEPCPGEPPDAVDGLEERLTTSSERPVRFWAEPVKGDVHVHPAHLNQLGDEVFVQVGAVRADADIHLRPSKGANHSQEIRVDGGLATSQRHTPNPAFVKPGDQNVLHVRQRHG